MFCPRCAAHNIDDAKYCRVCGADISLLPQVLSGQLTAEPAVADDAIADKSSRRRKRRDKEKAPPTFEKAFENIGTGIAFLIISVMVALFMPGGRFWWFWMLIPALACAGEGVGQLLRLKNEKGLAAGRGPLFPASREAEVKSLPPRNTSEMVMPPPSVTEHTTRHLSVEPQSGDAHEPAERPESMIDSNLK
jgi:hypothetical protein